MKVVPILYGAAAVLALSGVWLRIARSSLPSADPKELRLPAQPQPPAAGDVAPAAASYQLIVDQNIFSQQRGAPAPAKTAPARSDKPRETEPALALRGTTIGPRGAVALIGAEIHRVGDIVDGAKLVAITDSTVTLERPTGPVVLHVPNSQRKKL